MTHMWKSEEVYTFDMPGRRVEDVYGKNAIFPLQPYLKFYNPKIMEVRFDKQYALLHVVIAVPKYPETCPYFTQEDQNQLLETYMNFANAEPEEIMAWYYDRQRENNESN